jgi:Right handed beta helix region
MRLSRIAASFIALAVIILPIRPSLAALYFFSQGGTGTACTLAAPCSLAQAVANEGVDAQGFEIACADSSDSAVNSDAGLVITQSVTIDCAGTAGSIGVLTIDNGAVVTLRNFTMWDDALLQGRAQATAITLKHGTLILDNVHITGTFTNAITANPTSPSVIVVRNCVFDHNSGGVSLKPQTGGGSLSAVFDHVTISSNSGGGIKIDTTNAPVTVDITDSVISNNAGNGINAVGGAGGPAMFNIHNSVIAKNGAAGIQVNGGTAAAMIDTTLLDSNVAGATSVVNSGRLLTYGNNRIVGADGSGFTGSATLR